MPTLLANLVCVVGLWALTLWLLANQNPWGVLTVLMAQVVTIVFLRGEPFPFRRNRPLK